MLPDPGFYKECLQQTFDELERETLSQKAPARKKRSPRRARRA
jgi:hypothetical protein